VLAAGRYALSLVLADDSLVADLNATWRGHAGPTNVLSFAAQAGAPPPTPASLAVPVLLGDVVLARQTVEREAAASAKSPRAHALHLVMHGVLHCLGFAHDDPDAAAEMETLEIEAMGDLGLENPYIDRQEDPNLAVAEDRGGEAGRDM